MHFVVVGVLLHGGWHQVMLETFDIFCQEQKMIDYSLSEISFSFLFFMPNIEFREE